MDYQEALKYDVAQIIGGYRRLREAIQERARQHIEELKPHRAQLDVYEAALKTKIQETGGTSIRTDNGTAFFSEVTNIKMEDWEAFHAFVEELQEPDFLTRAANKTKVQEWMAANKQIPPGLSVTTVMNINVRAS